MSQFKKYLRESIRRALGEQLGTQSPPSGKGPYVSPAQSVSSFPDPPASGEYPKQVTTSDGVVHYLSYENGVVSYRPPLPPGFTFDVPSFPDPPDSGEYPRRVTTRDGVVHYLSFESGVLSYRPPLPPGFTF